MNLFYFHSKKEFKKTEAKKKISLLAKRVNQINKANQIMQNEYDFWIIYADLIKTVLNRYMSSSNGLTINNIMNEVNETQAKLRVSNDHLKQDIDSIRLKLEQLLSTLDDETKNLNVELEKKREEMFFTENKVIFRQFLVEKTKKEIENVNIIQELERDVYIPEFEKAFSVFNNENNRQQEVLTRIGKELNSEKLRKVELYKKCSMLKKELKAHYHSLNPNDSNAFTKNRTNLVPNNNNVDNKRLNLGQDNDNALIKVIKNASSNDSVASLTEKAKELENLSFIDFSEEKSFEKDEGLFFPDKITMPEQSKEGIPNLKLKIQLPNSTSNQPIPKLDLKQIEFNKSKVKDKFINIYSNNYNQNEEGNDDDDNDDNDYNNQNDNIDDHNNSNSKNNNQNKNTKPNTYSTNQKTNKIDQVRLDINAMKEKIKKNKKKINKFKKFYKGLFIKYDRLQVQYEQHKTNDKKKHLSNKNQSNKPISDDNILVNNNGQVD